MDTTQTDLEAVDLVRAALLGQTWAVVPELVVRGVTPKRVRDAIAYLVAQGEAVIPPRSKIQKVRLVVPGTRVRRPTADEIDGLTLLYGLSVDSWVALPPVSRRNIMSHVGVYLRRRKADDDPAYAAEQLARALRGQGWVQWSRCQRQAGVLGRTSAMSAAVSYLESAGRIEVVRSAARRGGRVSTKLRLVE